MTSTPFWSLHTHSRYSVNDAMPHVERIVNKAVELGYPALGLTDHGSIAGVPALYTACRKAGIEPLPGIELYVTPDSELGQRKNNHLTVVAYSETGYRNLCKLATFTSRKFFFKPRIDMADFVTLADDGVLGGLAVSTGCYFGVAVQRLVTRGPQAASRIVEYLAGLFPRVYVELQNHGIADAENDQYDDEIVEAMYGIAQHLGLPVVIAQDSHYCEPHEQPLHDQFKELVSWSDDPDDAIFPGDGYHMVDADYLSKYFEPKILDEALMNLADLAEWSRVRIPELEQFQMKVPDVTVTGDAQAELEQRVIQALGELDYDYLRDGDRYADRLNAELEVIKDAGMAGMLLLVAMVTDFMTRENIWFAARGSASGSLVCRLLGITQLDPVARDLDFTRFLSRDRTKPPDIDLDVEHLRRPEVGRFLAQHFVIAQVGTHMTYSLFEDEDISDNAKGSLLQRYHTVRNKKELPKIAWRDMPAEDKAALEALAKMELISGYGKHPAGFVIAPDEATLAQLPLSYIASSQSVISAYNKKDVEKLGYVKLDLLGLRDRTALRITCNTLGITDQKEVPGYVRWDDKDTFKRICEGKTEGVFQLQGFSMMKGVQRLQPKTLDDIAVAQALFRPAATASGATSDYLARRKGRMKTPERHKDISSVTKDTYGVLLYQEQMVAVLRNLGMSPEELTEMLDAVKASNKYTAGAKVAIEAMLPHIREMAEARGWYDGDIDWLADALVAFADYSFNKAHASSYGDNAFVSAFLATHHGQEFWLGLLSAYADTTDKTKIPRMTAAARRYGVKIRPVHVNVSDVGPIIDPSGNGIRKGLVTVKGVGAVIAAEIVKARRDGEFTSLKDFGQRVNTSKVSGAKALAVGTDPMSCGGAVQALFDAAAFDGLEGAR